MDAEIEKRWREEVSNRKKLLEEGKLETLSYEEFFNEGR